MDQVRIGIIGCGIGSYHADAFSQVPRARIVALAGQDGDRCNEICRKHAIPDLYQTYEELLARPDIDAVSIAAPNHLHLPMTLDALAAGKHVLVEKPIARNAAEGEQMVTAARDAGKILGIVFSKRHRPDVAVLRQHIADNGLGEIYYAKGFWMRRSGIPGLGGWFTNKELAGGGPLIDLGVHVLDLTLFLMGNPTIVSVSGSTYSKLGPQGKGHWAGNRFKVQQNVRFDVEDLATAFIRTSDGATIHLEASWAAYTGVTDEFGVQLIGDRGGALMHVRDYAKTGTLTLYGDVAGVPVDSTPRLTPQEEHLQIALRFVASILDGEPMSPSGEEGLDRARIIDAIYASAEAGRELRLDAAGPESLAAD